MKRWIISLLALVSVSSLQSCGPLDGGDPLDGAGPSRVGSSYPSQTGPEGIRRTMGIDTSVDF